MWPRVSQPAILLPELGLWPLLPAPPSLQTTVSGEQPQKTSHTLSPCMVSAYQGKFLSLQLETLRGTCFRSKKYLRKKHFAGYWPPCKISLPYPPMKFHASIKHKITWETTQKSGRLQSKSVEHFLHQHFQQHCSLLGNQYALLPTFIQYIITSITLLLWSCMYSVTSRGRCWCRFLVVVQSGHLG